MVNLASKVDLGVCSESFAVVSNEEVAGGKFHIQYALRTHKCTHLSRRVGRYICRVGTLIDRVGEVVLLAERCTARVTRSPEHIRNRREWIPTRARLARRQEVLVVGKLAPLLHIGVRKLVVSRCRNNLYVGLLLVGITNDLILGVLLQTTNNSLYEALLVAVVRGVQIFCIPLILHLYPLLRATLAVGKADGCTVDVGSLYPDDICSCRDILEVESHLGRYDYQLPDCRAIVCCNSDGASALCVVEIGRHIGNLRIVVGWAWAKAQIGGLNLVERVVLTTLYDGTVSLGIPLGRANLTIDSPDAIDGLCSHNLPLVGLEVGESDILRLRHIYNAVVQILRHYNLRVVCLVADVGYNICSEGYALELYRLDIGLLGERNGGGVGRAVEYDISACALDIERGDKEIDRRLGQVVLDARSERQSRKECYNNSSVHYCNLNFCSFFLLHKCTVTPMLISAIFRRNANFE